MFGAEMQMHVLAVEYPGYGLYKTSRPDEEKMKEDADTVYDYLTQVVGVKEDVEAVFAILERLGEDVGRCCKNSSQPCYPLIPSNKQSFMQK